MLKWFLDVIKFNKKVIKLKPLKKKEVMTIERQFWFVNVVKEEMFEFIKACKENDITGKIDALLDMQYFILGRLYECGFTPEEVEFHWNNIHKANMRKIKGNKGRGSDDDAIKPEGWKSPEELFIKKFLKGEKVK